LAFVILCIVPRDTKIVCDFDIIFVESVEDCGNMWRGLDDADEVIKVMMKIEPTEFRLEDPMESFAEQIEKKRRC
jgi:hypothetical protein